MLQHVKLTLTGAVQKLSDGIANPVASAQTGDALAAKDVPCRQIQLSALGANAAAIFIGGDSTVSSTNYGLRINAPPATIPDRPVAIESFDSGGIRPSDVFVVGTNADVLLAMLTRL